MTETKSSGGEGQSDDGQYGRPRKLVSDSAVSFLAPELARMVASAGDIRGAWIEFVGGNNLRIAAFCVGRVAKKDLGAQAVAVLLVVCRFSLGLGQCVVGHLFHTYSSNSGNLQVRTFAEIPSLHSETGPVAGIERAPNAERQQKNAKQH